MYGTQTIVDSFKKEFWFENDVKMYGTQIKFILKKYGRLILRKIERKHGGRNLNIHKK